MYCKSQDERFQNQWQTASVFLKISPHIHMLKYYLNPNLKMDYKIMLRIILGGCKFLQEEELYSLHSCIHSFDPF